MKMKIAVLNFSLKMINSSLRRSKSFVSRIVTEESLELEFVLTVEGEEPDMYGIDDYALAETKYGAEIIVYGTYQGLGSMGVPIISAIIVE